MAVIDSEKKKVESLIYVVAIGVFGNWSFSYSLCGSYTSVLKIGST